jgi:hypothetical protein
MSPRDMPIRYILWPWVCFTLGVGSVYFWELGPFRFGPVYTGIELAGLAIGYGSLAYGFGLWQIHRLLKKEAQKKNAAT